MQNTPNTILNSIVFLFRILKRIIPRGMTCLLIITALFGYIGSVMGVADMLNTIMNTAHDLLLNTVFYLMGICVIMGALGRLFVEFGVVDLLERILRPLMRPIFHMPGVASLGGVMTFLSDNPAIISLAQDKRFSFYFKKYQFISLTNFGTAFGMGLIVIVFMIGQGFTFEPLIGFFGAMCGCMVSTRLMQRAILKRHPHYKEENAAWGPSIHTLSEARAAGITCGPPLRKQPNIQSTKSLEQLEKDTKERPTLFLRILNALLDGGKTGVDVGISIIPGVLIISTLVMILTFGTGTEGVYSGKAYEGIELLPAIANKLDWFFYYLFGFTDPHQIAFPITALGAVGAALGLIPEFLASGWVDGNAIAVFTAIGMCWSGFLSTHTAMLDALGYRELTSKAILSHTIGGLIAAIVAHWTYVAIMPIL